MPGVGVSALSMSRKVIMKVVTGIQWVPFGAPIGLVAFGPSQSGLRQRTCDPNLGIGSSPFWSSR